MRRFYIGNPGSIFNNEVVKGKREVRSYTAPLYRWGNGNRLMVPMGMAGL
jgi:hypothetical protein